MEKEPLIEQKNFRFYGVAIKKDARFYMASIEYYNPVTCYIVNDSFATLFKTLKQANNFKKEILKWKKENRYLKDVFANFEYVTVCEISEIRWR